MARPSIKNGYTKIANEILEVLSKTNLNGSQYRILITILRFTYGFSKIEREFKLSFIGQHTDMKKSNVSRELTALIERNIIVVNGTGEQRGKVLSFNKNYDEWLDKAESEQQKEQSSEQTIEQEGEEVIDKKPSKKLKYDEDNTYYKMAVYFHKLVSKTAKEANVEHLIKKANLQSWADDFRKLVEIDGVDKRLAKDVMDWVSQDSFWKTNVLSAKKLREKFTDLAIKANTSKSKQNAPTSQYKPKNDIRDKEIEFQKWESEGHDPEKFKWN